MKKTQGLISLRHLKSETDEEKYTLTTKMKQMINHNLIKRFKIEKVLYHPTFYTVERKLGLFFLSLGEST